MFEIRRILCPIDFSDCSHRAVQYAAAVARRHGSTLEVLHVTPAGAGAQAPDAPESGPLGPTDVAAAVSRFVEAETTGIPVAVDIRRGTAADEILRRAGRADLIVMGTHGRSGFDRLILGSTTEKVLRKSDPPVLVVPRRISESTVAPATVFQRILCPIDFSGCSLDALRYAVSFAQMAGARLTVLHVMVYSMEEEAPEMYDTLLSDSRLTLGDLRSRFEACSRERLASAVSDAAGTSSSIEATLASGQPYREILRIATEQRADLIVMGVHGRGPADIMFFGSTTAHVVRQAHCPVLTIRRR